MIAQETVRRRLDQAEFVRRGLASLQKARTTGKYVDADAMVTRLRAQLRQAKSRTRATGSGR